MLSEVTRAASPTDDSGGPTRHFEEVGTLVPADVTGRFRQNGRLGTPEPQESWEPRGNDVFRRH